MSFFANDGHIIKNRFMIGSKLGSGSFGDIFEAYDQSTKQRVAIKLELANLKHKQLYHEFTVYNSLRGCEGIPNVHCYEKEKYYDLIVMDLLGPSLEELFEKCKRRFSLKTVLMLADQMLRRLESLHTRNFIHRDIKPENFLVGKLPEGAKDIYLVDFGLAKLYCDPETKEHSYYMDGKNLTGTARYASLNAHLGYELSRRDDLEELGHVLMYFNRGSLPWQGLCGKDRLTKYGKIYEMKKSISVTELCKNFPKEFKTFMLYARNLRFDERPDYRYLRRMFLNLFHRHNYRIDGMYDWVILDEIKQFSKKTLLEKRVTLLENDKDSNHEKNSSKFCQ